MYKYCYSNEGAIFAKGLFLWISVNRFLAVVSRRQKLKHNRGNKKKTNCFITHCFSHRLQFVFDKPCSYMNMKALLEFVHCARNLRVIH